MESSALSSGDNSVLVVSSVETVQQSLILSLFPDTQFFNNLKIVFQKVSEIQEFIPPLRKEGVGRKTTSYDGLYIS